MQGRWPRRGVAIVALLAVSGCGEDGPSESARVQQADRTDGATVAPVRCPGGIPACRSATGRIVLVERVDPDGDGDAHFVIRDPQGISAPGLTAIDVRKGLRPEPLPGPGDLISAAGPVQTGSYGQRQIHAIELRVAR
ncbi:MAG TPA: hypothetical protein VFY04_06405 [Solirubrobacterales bacterium]|nr:hypothetical protein [Solirubrobacterales bacterium]